MTKIAVIYHSGYGHTKVQAEHVEKGAKTVAQTEVTLFEVTEISEKLELLNDYDAMIFGAPTYMGSLSSSFKLFMEKTSGIWMSQSWKNKLAAGFTNSGSLSGDKLNSIFQLVVFAGQHSMIWVSLGELVEASDPSKITGDPSYVNRVGAYLGAMSQSDQLPPDKTPESGDLKTAEKLGLRVATLAKKWSP